MSIPFMTFRPAEYHKGKESFIHFYATDPATGKLRRKRIKLNHIRKKTERDKYASVLCHQLNEKLFAGWNPWIEQLGACAVTVRDAVDLFLKTKAKDSRKATMVSYKSMCKIFCDWLSETGYADKYVFTVDARMLQAYMQAMEERRGLSGCTYNNYLTFLCVLFEFFVEREFVKENPAAKLKKRRVEEKKRVVVPPDARARIKEYFEANNPNFVAVMLLCYRCLVRPKEIVSLRVRDYNRKDGTLVIPGTVSKNHHERVIALPDELRHHFDKLSDVPSDWFVFADARTFSPGRKAIAHTRISECWAAMRSELKLPASYQFYSLKDTGITEMLEAGVPAKYVKELADHHSLEMTERYTHRSEAKKILEWNKLEF